MCRRTQMIGNAVMALGAGLLISMLIPRSFWTVFVGVILVALGYFLGCKSN